MCFWSDSHASNLILVEFYRSHCRQQNCCKTPENVHLHIWENNEMATDVWECGRCNEWVTCLPSAVCWCTRKDEVANVFSTGWWQEGHPASKLHQLPATECTFLPLPSHHCCPLSPVSTTRVNGPSWRVIGFHYPSTRAVLTGTRFH